MNTIAKSDLLYSYTWSTIAGDDPRLTGKPDSVLLNRNEGYEVLYFINRFCSLHTFNNGQAATKAEALKAERLIRTQLPSNLRSRQHVSEWLEKNWGTYR